jgi:hypothetical protein
LPAVFVLLGIACGQLISWVSRKDDKFPKSYLWSYGLWALGSLFIWKFYFHGGSLVAGFTKYHETSFLPLPLWTIGSWRWLLAGVVNLFNSPADLTPAPMAFLLSVLGLYALYQTERKLFWQLLTPLLFVLLASAMRKYPFGGRFLIFAVPAIFLFVAEGVHYLMFQSQKARIPHFLIIGMLLINPLWRCGYHVVKPRQISEVRPLLIYLKNHQQKGDAIYLNNEAQYVYLYYRQYYRFPFSPKILGVLSDDIRADETGTFGYVFHSFRGFDSKLYQDGRLLPGQVNPQIHDMKEMALSQRTWLFFSQEKPQAEKYFFEYFCQKGKPVVKIKDVWTSLYLLTFPEGK